MKAIVFADRLGQELTPLTEKTSVALLPIVSKPILEHTIESLVMSDIRDITLVVSAYADAIEENLGTGNRWGAKFTYILSQGEENPSDIIQRLDMPTEETWLALRGDVLRSPVISQFLEQAQTLPGDYVLGLMIAQCASLCLCRSGCHPSVLAELRWTGETQPSRQDNQIILEANDSCLESLQSYHQANLDVMAGRFSGLIIPGKQTALGLTTGPRSQISPKSLKQGFAFVGATCRIHPEAELLNDVVINNNVIIDRGATVQSSVILPNTYIGELVEVKNAIVWGNDLIRVDTGAVLHVSEAFLLGDLQTHVLNNSIAGALHRVLGLGLLIASLPLWIVAFIAALWHKPSQPLKKQQLEGNQITLDELGNRQRKIFTTWLWNTPIPILRYLPRLIATLTGDLRLVGTLPFSPSQLAERLAEWEKVRDEAPVGLIGPTQLNLPTKVPIEEKFMSDAFYAKLRSTGKDLGYLWQGVCVLFSRRAWWVQGQCH